MPEIDKIDDLDRRIIDALQGDFPLTPHPYADAAAKLGIGEEELIKRLQSLLDRRVLTRFGPMFQIERMGGSFVLAAMQVPEADWDRVVAAVNAFPEVAHNYRREHRFNMWFVLATETLAGIDDVVSRITAATGMTVHTFPKHTEYFVEMKLKTRAA